MLKNLGLLFLFLVASTTSAQAASSEIQNYRHAFTLLDDNHPEQAVLFASHGHDEILNKILHAAAMAQPGNPYSFDALAAFINQETNWPNLKAIQAVAEQKFPPNVSPAKTISWFQAHPPVSVNGVYLYANALNATSQTQVAQNLVRDHWVKDDFTVDDLASFTTRFSNQLNREAIWARLDRLTWKNDITHARNLYPLVSEDMKTVTEARLALANRTDNAEAWMDRVPDSWQNDAGLLFEHLRWLRKNNRDDAAIDILRRAPTELGNPAAWWEEREIMTRRLMQHHDYDAAYELAAHHGQTEPRNIVQAEFLAGWIALRFLNEPERAREHFQILYDKASTPLSRSRGAYWLGRAAEAAHDTPMADQYFATAASFNMTYYGQLAEARLDARPVAQATPEPAVPPQIRSIFYTHDLVRATERLAQIGERDRAKVFFRAAVEQAVQRVDFALLTELAYRIGRPDLAIETAKTANQKNMAITAGGYPLLTLSLVQPPEPALTHALIRQESMFNPEAESSSGARGLMQLMTATAKDVARKLGLHFKPKHLDNSTFNVRLGTHYVQHQIDVFDGSYILAIAAYNAGPGRVHEWIGQIGDPRRGDIDPIDWIESIPVYETRNYVQRVVENLQIYRARLNGGQAPLMIAQDLKR